MSDILIKGMKMPKSCPCELVGVGYDLHCAFAYGVPSRVREYYECCEKETRPEWCPIVEIKPHGDLIDRDAVMSKYYDWFYSYDGERTYENMFYRLLTIIKDAPKIIEGAGT